MNKAATSLGLAALLLLVGCGANPRPDQMDMAMDMAPVLSCSQLCSRFATCYIAAHPEYVPGPMAIGGCEITCYSDSEQARTDLRACFVNDCFVYLACGTTAGLKLAAKAPPPPDAAFSDGLSAGDGSSTMTDLSPPLDASMPEDMSTPDDATSSDLQTD